MLTRRSLAQAAGGLAALPATLAKAQPTQAAAPSGPPLRIGFGMALSGGIASGGKAVLLTYELWREQVNASGGILGRPVEFVYYDDQSTPATVPGIYSKLLDVDRVDLVISGYGSNQIAAAMPIIMQKQKLFSANFGLDVNAQFRYDRYFQAQPNGPHARLELSNGFFEIAAGLDPKPRTIAFTGADAEYPHTALDGARENARKAGLRVVYDRTYPPNQVEFGSAMRAIKAARPDLVFRASYPPDSAGLVRAASETALQAKLFGGGMIGLQYTALKTQLGPLLNGVLYYDMWVPEPTMRFPGVEQFLQRYQARAGREGVDQLGFYLPPLSYGQMQVLEQAIKTVGSLDDGALARHMHSATFDTVVGPIRYAASGEWAEAQVLYVQYQGISGNGVEQFMQPGRQIVLYPERFKSGTLVQPFPPPRA